MLPPLSPCPPCPPPSTPIPTPTPTGSRDGAEATLMYDTEGRPIPDEVHLAGEDKYAEILGELLDR